jgi:molybdopterin synthase catalytic subunit
VLSVSISEVSIDPARLQRDFPRNAQTTGAVASFSGYVRGDGITAMALEHYPGMTERCIEDSMRSAARRWPVQAAQVVHRVGELMPGDPIVWVAVASAHRAAAFSACEFIMDYLKVSAPLWKRERSLAGDWRWVAAREQDSERARRWGGGGTLHAGEGVSRAGAAGTAQ